MKVLRILRNIGLIILAILLIAIGIIYWKKDALIRSAVDTTAEQVGLDIQYQSASLSLFSTFPDVGISLDSLVIGSKDTTQSPLSTIQRLTLGVQFWSLFSEEGYELNQIILDQPRLDLNCNKKGHCNYDVLLQDESLEDTSVQQSGAMKLSIENFEINNGSLNYTDSIQLMQLSIDQWNFRLQGSYADNVLNADLQQENMILGFVSDGLQYADSLQLTGNGRLAYNMDDSRIEFSGNEWTFNELKLMLDGMFTMREDDYDMDLSFHLPSNELKPLLSLIPVFYDENYEDLVSEGSFSLDGNVKGQLDTENEVYPSFLLNAVIENGRIKYPDLPEDIHDINLKAHIEKEEGALDKTIVQVPDLQMMMGSNSKLKGSFNVRQPISNPLVTGSILMDAELENIQKVYPMESIQQLAGKLHLDADFDLDMEQLQNEAYDQMQISGNANINGLSVKASNQPAVSLNTMTASLNGGGVKANMKGLTAGASDINTLSLSTGPIGLYFQKNKNFPMDISFDAGTVLVDEWMPDTEETGTQTSMQSPYDLSGYRITFDGMVKELIYSIYRIKSIDVAGVFENGQIEIESSRFTYEGSNFSMNGNIKQLEEYLNETGPFYADLSLNGGRFDLYDYMYGMEDGAVAQEGNATDEYFYLSSDMQLDIAYTLQGIDYGDIALNNVNGSLSLQDGNIQIRPTDMDGMGGQLNVEGSFKTNKGSAPIFDFNAAVQSLQFSNTFNSIATLDKVAPLLGRLKGIFDARLSTTGSLDKELYPNIGDLDAQGFIATKNVVLQSYEPISRLDNALGTNLSSDFPLENTQNWFAVQDGAVIIEPFKVELFQENWKIEGRHQIGGDMNYQFSGPIPIDVIKTTEPGRKLVQEAQGIFKQIPLTSDLVLEKIDVQVLLSGTRNNPQVKLNLASNFRDLVTERLKDRVNTQKEEIKKEVEGTLDEAGQAVKEAAKDKAKELITGKKDTSQQGQPIDSLKKKAEDKIEEAKEKLNKWNPFKNKKG